MPAKSKVQASFAQSKNPILPRLPCRLLMLGPSGAGKSSLIVKLITDPKSEDNLTLIDLIKFVSLTSVISIFIK